MEVEIRIEPGRQEPKAVILTGEETGALLELAQRLRAMALGPIPVRRGEEVLLLPQESFLRFYTDGKGVSGQTAEEICAVPLRLYELEERLDATRFVRISNGEIVNLDRVTAVQYTSGHMPYLGEETAEALERDIRAFLQGGRERI